MTPRTRTSGLLLLATLALGPLLRTSRSQTSAQATSIAFSALPRSTQEHLRASAWWPTKPLATPTGFVGVKVCAQCHSEIADSQRTSQMARTLTPAAVSQVLAGHLHDAFHSGPYTDTLARTPTGFGLSVTDGAATEGAALDWAFGSGDVGQSYLWQGADGSFHEARFNYFRSLNTFADTPGRLHGAPTSLPMALSREIEGFEAQTCFRCHTTTLSAALPLNPRTVVPGVTCEACHGPGAAHVAAVNAADAADTPLPSAMTAGAPQGGVIPTEAAGAVEGPAVSNTAERLSILNPSRLTPADSVDLCGSCHSTPTDVRLMGAVGLQTVRFPAYRLTGSRCWLASSPAVPPGAGDARLTCQSCHNPHAPLERTSANYDSACLRCHTNRPGALEHTIPTAPTHKFVILSGAAGVVEGPAVPASTARTQPHPAPACPVATRQCTSCHMPKFEIPEMHAKFTDHRIRIAHPGEPFPDTLPTQRAATH